MRHVHHEFAAVVLGPDRFVDGGEIGLRELHLDNRTAHGREAPVGGTRENG
jgi:hypothetical protein